MLSHAVEVVGRPRMSERWSQMPVMRTGSSPSRPSGPSHPIQVPGRIIAGAARATDRDRNQRRAETQRSGATIVRWVSRRGGSTGVS